MKRAGPIPEEALPATDWPATVVIGPSRITKLITVRAVARKAAVRTPKLVRVGRDTALALPGGTPTWWKSGGRILDATARGDKPDRKRRSHSDYEVLDFELAAGTYSIDHCEREGVYLFDGKRSAYSLEAFRLRR